MTFDMFNVSILTSIDRYVSANGSGQLPFPRDLYMAQLNSCGKMEMEFTFYIMWNGSVTETMLILHVLHVNFPNPGNGSRKYFLDKCYLKTKVILKILNTKHSQESINWYFTALSKCYI